MFDAAPGALILSGAAADPAETRTHSGLIGAFGKHLVKTGRIPTDLGRVLNQVERMRLLADYTSEEIKPGCALGRRAGRRIRLRHQGHLRP